MARTVRVAAIQLNSGEEKEANLARALELVAEAAEQGARWVALPEMFSYLGREERHREVAELIPGPTTERLAEAARQHGICLLGGSIPERLGGSDKVANTSTLFDPQGRLIALYRKVHLFDVEVAGASHRESATVAAGGEIVSAEADGITVGLTICYDLRFPELYRILALRGARVIFVPSAFTLQTGRDHWHLLLRARAVENEVYIVAPNHVGLHPPGQACYGHSLICDPWGVVLAEAPDREGVVLAELDFDYQEEVRARLPALRHRRPDAYAWPRD